MQAYKNFYQMSVFFSANVKHEILVLPSFRVVSRHPLQATFLKFLFGVRGAHFSFNFYHFCVGRVQMEGPLFVFFPNIK